MTHTATAVATAVARGTLATPNVAKGTLATTPSQARPKHPRREGHPRDTQRRKGHPRNATSSTTRIRMRVVGEPEPHP